CTSNPEHTRSLQPACTHPAHAATLSETEPYHFQHFPIILVFQKTVAPKASLNQATANARSHETTRPHTRRRLRRTRTHHHAIRSHTRPARPNTHRQERHIPLRLLKTRHHVRTRETRRRPLPIQSNQKARR